MVSKKYSRSSSRLAAIQGVYAYEIDQVKESKLKNDLLYYYKNQEDDVGNFPEPEEGFLSKLISNTLNNVNSLDPVIADQLSENWTLEKLPLVLKSILRCAVCEIIHFKDNPSIVIIDEYTKLTKVFCNIKEVGFVNGILDKISKKVRSE